MRNTRFSVKMVPLPSNVAVSVAGRTAPPPTATWTALPKGACPYRTAVGQVWYIHVVGAPLTIQPDHQEGCPLSGWNSLSVSTTRVVIRDPPTPRERCHKSRAASPLPLARQVCTVGPTVARGTRFRTSTEGNQRIGAQPRPPERRRIWRVDVGALHRCLRRRARRHTHPIFPVLMGRDSGNVVTSHEDSRTRSARRPAIAIAVVDATWVAWQSHLRGSWKTAESSAVRYYCMQTGWRGARRKPPRPPPQPPPPPPPPPPPRSPRGCIRGA